jgi:hypothetical protein
MKNKKQNIMTRSSTEAKYWEMTSTVSELAWIEQVLADLNIDVKDPIKIFCENQSVRHITTKLNFMSASNKLK